MTDETEVSSALAALADEMPALHVDLDRVVRRAHQRRGQRQAVLLTTVSTVVVGGLVATMITLTAGREPPVGQQPAPPLTHEAGWTVTPVPQLDHMVVLKAVAPVTQSDVWAVGSASGDTRNDPQSVESKTVMVHWDGERWLRAGPADPGMLADVAAISSNDVWAVGGVQTRTLASHWDGRNWTVTPTPSPEPGPGLTSSLRGLAPVATDDVWAVGCQWSAGQAYRSTPLAQHWDGQRWTEVDLPPIPDAPQGACLESVAARGPNDIFAVGHVYGGNVKGGDLTLHWDGTQWSVIPRLTGGAAPYYPLKVIVAGDQVLAVGQSYSLNNGAGSKAAILRWDGSGWQPILVDALQLYGATSDGHGGTVVAGAGYGSSPPALFHGTGGDFLPPKELPDNLTAFSALATVPGTDIVWAVGSARTQVAGAETVEISPGQSIAVLPGSGITEFRPGQTPPSTARVRLWTPGVGPWAGFMSFGG